MDAPPTIALAKRWTLESFQRRNSPSGLLISTKPAAAREHYDAAQEGHGYVYSQRAYIAHPGSPKHDNWWDEIHA
jgi:hypothetical protein